MQWGGVRRQKYFVWYETRKNKTISALALSLSLDLRATFKIDAIRDNMDAALGDAQAQAQRVCMVDIAKKVALLHQANGEFAEWHNGSLLLSISVEAFRDLAREHGDWINNHDRKTLVLAEELQRPHAAEHQHD
ncbi:hypothetical protein PC121_g11173 [Phytophthora cactorum]|nr:hypothetical protein PC120_g6821 [Phytophthora cactorum]KAG3065796.1 hypothetical protein PC121_g11173 [Phytophthora cactorum]